MSGTEILMPYLERQQQQMNNIEKQLEKLTDVIMRIALLEERRTADRAQVEELKNKIEEVEARQTVIKDKIPGFEEMLDSYKKFKNVVITFLCGGLLLAAVAFGSGVVKLAPH